MATLNSSNIVNNNVILTSDLLQLYNALNYVGASTQYLVSLSGSLEGTASYATTASFALNGGGGGGAVTQILTGSNITISPSTGVGAVTINATTPAGTFPYIGDAVISGSLIITGSNLGADLIVTGSVIATQGFTGSLFGTAATASYVVTAQTASFVTTAQTASYVATSSNSTNSILSQTSSKVTVSNNQTTATNLPLIFGTSSAAGTQQLNIDSDAGGPTYNPLFNSISSNRFTGSLLGTSTQAVSSSTATTATTAYNINTLATTTNAFHFLTFVDTNNATATAETLFTTTNLKINPSNGLLIATTLSSSAITASSITSSFTGSLLGTSSLATAATKIQTVGIATNALHYLTFVDANNGTPTAESLYTDSNISFNPSTNILSVTGSITSSFTGSLLGTSSNANTASYALTASVPNSTTQWYSYNSAQAIPAGRDVGIVHTYAGTSLITYRLNTSSCQVGDQVQIATVGTFTANGVIGFTTSGSTANSGSIVVAGYTNNPSSFHTVSPTYTDVSGSQASWKWVCVKASNRATWQLVNYMDRKVAIDGIWDLNVT
jgi:hypothetical protein